ncbi:hypothetical protein GCM10022225_42770 [Plantactinospora mayteni]|uniref:Uncharacterized protein n=1 Tax=Plantactinospora mayteni TaxID=566021 RepID=A0ABQ4ES82_9ACTN|nr:hypothetical protein [Plantactinospora mayteni]GIG97512.1 hypothetical protein Pma05_40850 [Plantactinospora mayteni]
MRTTTVVKSLVGTAAVAVALSSAAWSAVVGGDQEGTASVRALTAAAGQGMHSDYEPLTSPADAVDSADLIVQGTVVEIGDGIQVTYPDEAMTRREANAYATFVVAVDKVLHGDAGRVTDGKVYLAVPKGSRATPDSLDALNPQARVVAVLGDLTTWRPYPTATVVRPSAIPAGAALWGPYVDGMWMQGAQDAEMLAIEAEHSELPPGWGGVRTLAELATAIEKAAGTR